MTRRSALFAPATLLCAALAACTSSSAAADPAKHAASLLTTAKATLDKSSSIHFDLTSADVPPGANALTAGNGNAARPDKFAGDLEVFVMATKAKVSVISLGGKVYAKLPFAAKYEVTDPKQFNIPDPGKFMSPDVGLTLLLAKATSAKAGGTSRVGSAVVQQVTAELPGTVVGQVLVIADPTKTVAATFGIDEKTGQLLQAKLVGPFFAKGFNSTYTLVLSKYGEHVDISAPPA